MTYLKALVRMAILGAILGLSSGTAQAQPWTGVGSTGVVVGGTLYYDCLTQAIGFFVQSPAVFPGCLAPVRTESTSTRSTTYDQSSATTGNGASNAGFRHVPAGSGRVLYNVVAEPNIVSANISMVVRYLVTDSANQHILVRLIRQPRDPIPNSFSVATLITLNSDDFASASGTQTHKVGSCPGPTLDFANNAYFIAADISNARTNGGGVGLYQVAIDQAECLE